MRPTSRALSSFLLSVLAFTCAVSTGAAAQQAAPAAHANKPAIVGASKPATTSGNSTASNGDDDATAAPVKIKPMRDPALYRTEVTLTSQGDNERRAATARGLGQVIVKLTGNVQAVGNPVIRKAMPSAQSYVSDAKTETAASDSEGNTAVGGAPIYKTTMSLAYDPVAVDALIAGAGLKYWTGIRPKPILWLAIDDGRGARLVTGQQINVVKPLAQRGLERGLRFLLPAGSAVEQSALASILALNASALQTLTARYGNDAQLVGKIYRANGGWTGDWVLSQAGVELSRWTFSDPDARRVIASGADTSADAIAQRDAVYLSIGAAGSYMIDIAGVDNQAEFVKVMAYLQRLAIVKHVTVVEAAPDHLRLLMDLGLGPTGFRMIIATDDVLVPLSTPDAPVTPPPAPGSDDAALGLPPPPPSNVPRYGLK
ncbi:MAG TPA: DUF2066 domain-containing protein [Arenimonas sp.]|uniref:DUF2066 domain-containing protein n=1 Tax=Arenimonas sp. TaxID=1872635 RepID=UPI002D17F638|nr:DUF2066 domain-containing protein [Arenimonas sp.]HMB56858.1 DUF2066 domain-containing protein [Arenimonas sp.]